MNTSYNEDHIGRPTNLPSLYQGFTWLDDSVDAGEPFYTPVCSSAPGETLNWCLVIGIPCADVTVDHSSQGVGVNFRQRLPISI